MSPPLTILAFGLLVCTSIGSALPSAKISSGNVRRQDVVGEPEAPLILSLLNSTLPYVLPMFDNDTSSRAEEILTNRAGYLYGPSLLGNASYFPTGSLGDALVAQEVEYFSLDAAVQTVLVTNDSAKVQQTIEASPGVTALASFNILYEDQWTKSLPSGLAPGALTNYTQDLFFSMERLSSNPYIVKRISASNALPFMVDDSLVAEIAGVLSLSALHLEGRLFHADYTLLDNPARYPVSSGKYAAACQAYFYIDPISGDFLPLAIKPSTKSDLVYTPLDEKADWLLAKILFNANDQFYGQIYHLAASHDVAEIVYEAALRTISIKHPVRGFLDSLMYQAFAIRPVGEKVLFNTGGPFDEAFSIGNIGARNLTADLYASNAGQFKANYLYTNFLSRGLVGSSGPALKYNPYYSDASTIVASFSQFLTVYIQTYYSDEALILEDAELQNWAAEANGPAEVLDFPASFTTTSDLIEALVHMAFLAGVSHHVLNGNALPTLPAVLPFHPTAIYQPIPTEKGITSGQLLTFLPNLTQSVEQIALVTRFNRPLLQVENKTLPFMFDSPLFLGDMKSSLVQAAQTFKGQMMNLSAVIRSRKFDGKGLSEGMPFVWQFLDPLKIPFFLNI